MTIALEDDLSHAIRCMAEKCITSLPIIADKKAVGFVSERTIVRAINSAFEIGGAFVDEAKIQDIRYDMPYGDDIDTYGYVSRDATVYDVENMFSDAVKDKRRLLAILVSDNGAESAMPLGIITTWDLYKIDKQKSKLDRVVTVVKRESILRQHVVREVLVFWILRLTCVKSLIVVMKSPPAA